MELTKAIESLSTQNHVIGEYAFMVNEGSGTALTLILYIVDQCNEVGNFEMAKRFGIPEIAAILRSHAAFVNAWAAVKATGECVKNSN